MKLKRFALLCFILCSGVLLGQAPAVVVGTQTVLTGITDASKYTEAFDKCMSNGGNSFACLPIAINAQGEDIANRVDTAIRALIQASGTAAPQILSATHLRADTMSFSYYKTLTIQTGQVPSSQSGFPALLPFLGGDANLATVANGGHVQSASGFDIRPYSDSALTSPLTFELVSYNATTGAFEMWVNMTAVDGGVVYLAYGDSGITTDGSSTSTWNSNYKSVWHLKDGTTLSVADSTSNANNLTNNSSVAAASGQIDGAMQSNGTSSYMSGGNGSLTTAGASTIEMWLKNLSGAGLLGFMGLEASSAEIATAYFDSTRNGFLVANANGSSKPNTSITTSNWNHLAIVNSGSARPALYINGSQNDVNDGASLSAWVGTGINLGRGVNFSFSASAAIDEVRLSNVSRSANWITTEYNNQFAPTSFWSTGSETAFGGSFNVSISGSIPSSGALAKQAQKPFAGTITSAGVLTKKPGKALSGTITSAGVLTNVKVILVALAGTITSAGTLVKRTAKSFTASIASSGALLNRTSKSFAGTITSSATLSNIRVILLSLSGTVTSSGQFVKRAGKSLAGSIASSGSLVRSMATTFTGTMTSSGVLHKRTGKAFSGLITSASSLVTRILSSIFNPTVYLTAELHRSVTADVTLERTPTFTMVITRD
jgi:hypothetical protein